MLHQSKWTPVWVSILINRNTGIRTGVEVNERPVDVQSRGLTEAAAESESPYAPIKTDIH